MSSGVEWAQETKRMIDAEGGISEVIHADVTNEESCKYAVAKAVEMFGSVHILANIVGVGGAMGDATKVDMAAWHRDFRINVTSMVLMSRHVIPEMRRNGRGAIVNLSSVSGCASLPFAEHNASELMKSSIGRQSQPTLPYHKGRDRANDPCDGCSAWAREYSSQLRWCVDCINEVCAASDRSFSSGNGVHSYGCRARHDRRHAESSYWAKPDEEGRRRLGCRLW